MKFLLILFLISNSLKATTCFQKILTLGKKTKKETLCYRQDLNILISKKCIIGQCLANSHQNRISKAKLFSKKTAPLQMLCKVKKGKVLALYVEKIGNVDSCIFDDFSIIDLRKLYRDTLFAL